MKPEMMLKPIVWNDETIKYKEVIESNYSLSKSKAYILGLIRELDSSGQRRMARTLQLPCSRRESKKWPEMMFMKDIHSALQQAQRDHHARMRLMLAILESVISLFIEDDTNPLETFLSRERELVIEYGFWHYYWAFMLFAREKEEIELWEQSRTRMEEQAARLAESSGKADDDITPVMEMRQVAAKTGQAADKYGSISSDKMTQLEKKLSKETELRRRLELELAQYHKSIHNQDKELERIKQRLEEVKKQSELHLMEGEAKAERLERERKFHKEAQAAWQVERDSLLEQIQSMDKQLRQREKLAAELQERLQQEQKVTVHGASTRSAEPLQAIVKQLVNMLNKELGQLSSQLNLQDDLASGHAMREQIRKNIDLQDALEKYGKEMPRTETGIHLAKPDPPASERHFAEVDVPVYSGTFYRRDHGGYICLDNGETFNITESMVCNLGLQHKAEVQCHPQGENEQGILLYHVELLFQGDDTTSPIKQYEGYVELGEHHMWYCVDLSNPDNRYPIHHKDIQMQNPPDGIPCVFNVAEEGTFARLSRLYRDFMPSLKPQIKGSTSPRIAERIITEKNSDKQKLQPFLEGCLIAIVGGQRKWFEDVINETGAELIHDTGDSPERIISVLRRANALFMLLSSTSHRATWAGVETAKQFCIPYFTIQGSKSNLRSQLWDNRESIRAANSSKNRRS